MILLGLPFLYQTTASLCLFWLVQNSICHFGRDLKSSLLLFMQVTNSRLTKEAASVALELQSSLPYCVVHLSQCGSVAFPGELIQCKSVNVMTVSAII